MKNSGGWQEFTDFLLSRTSEEKIFLMTSHIALYIYIYVCLIFLLFICIYNIRKVNRTILWKLGLKGLKIKYQFLTKFYHHSQVGYLPPNRLPFYLILTNLCSLLHGFLCLFNTLFKVCKRIQYDFFSSIEKNHFFLMQWNVDTETLRKKCLYLELIWSAFSSTWIEYGEIWVSLHIQSECRKLRTRITPNMETFHAVNFCRIALDKF